MPQLAQADGAARESGEAHWSSPSTAESPLARQVKPHDVISAIDNQAIQSAEQAVKILNQRADHVQSVIGLDRPVNGEIERHNDPGALMNACSACSPGDLATGKCIVRRGKPRAPSDRCWTARRPKPPRRHS